MHKLKSSQKDKVKQFMQFTQCSEKSAIAFLQQRDWKLDLAIDSYFQTIDRGGPFSAYADSSGSPRGSFDRKKLEALWIKYRDQRADVQKIPAEGVMRFLGDLGLPPDSPLVLLLAWKFEAKTQCEFSRDEFINGMVRLGCDTLESLKPRLLSLEKEVDRDPAKFKDYYQFAFDYAKNPDQRSLDLEMAIAYWRILLCGRFKFIDLWIEFLQGNYNKSVPRDTWNLLLDFSRSIDEQMENYDENGAWPTLLDEFVEYSRPILQQRPKTTTV